MTQWINGAMDQFHDAGIFRRVLIIIPSDGETAITDRLVQPNGSGVAGADFEVGAFNAQCQELPVSFCEQRLPCPVTPITGSHRHVPQLCLVEDAMEGGKADHLSPFRAYCAGLCNQDQAGRVSSQPRVI